MCTSKSGLAEIKAIPQRQLRLTTASIWVAEVSRHYHSIRVCTLPRLPPTNQNPVVGA